MALFVKPRYSAGDPDSIKYLASVGLSYEELSTATLKKAKVTALDSTSEVTLDIDGNEYSNVPVWIHTDIGARNAMITDTEASAAVDYFQDAALIFQFAGNSESSYPYALAMMKETVEDEEVVIEPIAVIGVLQGTDIGDETNLSVTDDISSVVKAIADKQDTAYETYRPYFLLKFMDDEDVAYESLYSIADGTFVGGSAVVEYSSVAGSGYQQIQQVIGNSLLVENRTTSSFVASVPSEDPPIPEIARYVSAYPGITSGTTSFVDPETSETETVSVSILLYEPPSVIQYLGYDDSSDIVDNECDFALYNVVQATNLIDASECDAGAYLQIGHYSYINSTKKKGYEIVVESSYTGETYTLEPGFDEVSEWDIDPEENVYYNDGSGQYYIRCRYDYLMTVEEDVLCVSFRISNPIGLLSYDVYTEFLCGLGFSRNYTYGGEGQDSTGLGPSENFSYSDYTYDAVCKFGSSELPRKNVFGNTLSSAFPGIINYFTGLFSGVVSDSLFGSHDGDNTLYLKTLCSLYLVPFSATQSL